MSEKLNLVEILKDCPEGTKLYSPLYGEVRFFYITPGKSMPIAVLSGDTTYFFAMDGRKDPSINNQECLLFPSKDKRDWSTFKPKKPKFDPKTLQPFDKVLTRIDKEPYSYWVPDFVTWRFKDELVPFTLSDDDAEFVIPYNEETKHLVGTTDEAPEFYRYWEE